MQCKMSLAGRCVHCSFRGFFCHTFLKGGKTYDLATNSCLIFVCSEKDMQKLRSFLQNVYCCSFGQFSYEF